MKDCYVTSTGQFLPGDPVGNESIQRFLGTLDGEEDVKEKVLRMNGIKSRHYAQDEQQQASESVYSMATHAVVDALARREMMDDSSLAPISFLSAGSTYAPLAAPGIASIIHECIAQTPCYGKDFASPLEISSHAGVCTSSSSALVGAIRAVQSGEHASSIAIGSEHSSEVLKASKITPVDDRNEQTELRRTQWFMSVFLRFMLSDGAGAFVLENQPAKEGVSLKVDWTFSRSFADQTPLCMKLDNSNALLSQDVDVLSKFLIPRARKFASIAFSHHGESLANYRWVLPHLSSFFFRRKMERVLADFAVDSSDPEGRKNAIQYWTNLASAGNTGAASIFIMLNEFLRTEQLDEGDRLLLFIPESGQFNFVMISLTAVVS